ncbi:MAG: BACON domain-containing protein [Bacteroidales bacterium]|nr:BACON domain-containing protein [Bacteroidales bacterium]
MDKYIKGLFMCLLPALFSAAGCQEEVAPTSQVVLVEFTTLTLPAQDVTGEVIPLKADGKWTAEVSVDWLTLSQMSGEGNTDIIVTATDNMKNGVMAAPRKGTIRFNAAQPNNYGYLNTSSFSIAVTQKGDSYLGVEETTVTETLSLEDNCSAKVRGGQVVATAKKGFVVSDGTSNMYVSSEISVGLGDMISLNGTKTTLNGLSSFICEEVEVLSNAEVSYPEPKDITSQVDAYEPSAVEYVTVTGTVVGTELLNIEGASAKGVEFLEAPAELGMDEVAVHRIDLKGYCIGTSEDNHVIVAASFEDKGEDKDVCVEFPFRDDFSWTEAYIEEAKTVVASSKYPIDAVGSNTATGTNLPNIYSDIPSCLAELRDRGYVDLNPEFKAIYLCDGYLKYSISKKQSGITLPLVGITGTQDIYVQFNWCAEKNGAGKIDGVEMVVEIDGPGELENPSTDNPKVTAKMETTQTEGVLEWQEALVKIKDATMATRITIRPKKFGTPEDPVSGLYRYYLDNVAVLSQDDVAPANLTVEGPADDLFTFEGKPEGTQSFTVTSDKVFFVSTSANWFHVDVNSGEAYERTEVTVSCDESTLSTLRQGYITVKSGATTYRLSVVQSAAGMELEPFVSIVGGNSVEAAGKGEDVTVKVQSNVEYEVEVTEGADWLSAEKAVASKAMVEVSEIVLHASRNEGFSERSAKVRVYNEKEGVEAVVNVSQGLAFEDFAVWTLNTDTYAAHSATFATTGLDAGDGDAYVASDAGNGKITYVQVDKTGFDVKAENITRNVNDEECDLVAKGNWLGDYWLFTASRDGGQTIPAGSTFVFSFATRISSAGLMHWLVEYYDGTEWKPASEVSTETVGDAEVTYNIKHETTDVYEYEAVFNNSVDLNELQLHVSCVSVQRQSNGKVQTNPTGGNIRVKGGEYSPAIMVMYN